MVDGPVVVVEGAVVVVAGVEVVVDVDVGGVVVVVVGGAVVVVGAAVVVVLCGLLVVVDVGAAITEDSEVGGAPVVVVRIGALVELAMGCDTLGPPDPQPAIAMPAADNRTPRANRRGNLDFIIVTAPLLTARGLPRAVASPTTAVEDVAAHEGWSVRHQGGMTPPGRNHHDEEDNRCEASNPNGKVEGPLRSHHAIIVPRRDELCLGNANVPCGACRRGRGNAWVSI